MDETERIRCRNNSASEEKGGVVDFRSLGGALCWNADTLWFATDVPANLGYRGLRQDINYLVRFGCARFGDRTFRRFRHYFERIRILEWPAYKKAVVATG